jgi:hypothetical protein
MILIYKKFPNISLKQSVVIKLLKLATADIKKLLDDTLYKGKHPMACSEFVYQCYWMHPKTHGVKAETPQCRYLDQAAFRADGFSGGSFADYLSQSSHFSKICSDAVFDSGNA